MSFKEEIDFLKYGLNWKIPANAKSMPDNFKTNVSSVKRNDKTLVFTKPTGEVVNIILKDALGHGSYGETWTTDTRFDKDIEMVVKIIAYSEGDDTSDVEYDTIQEALIQIIIYECSKDFKDLSLNLIGPFCPKFYLLGRAGRTMFIVMERVTTSLDTILINNSKNPTKRASWKPPTAEFVRQIILQLTIILKQLYIKVGYNHRDLKPDNIMFNIVNGKPNLKLIDFGFSCLKYRDLYLKSISNEVYSTRLKHCDSETRDLHAFFYYFSYYTYYRELNCPLKRLIKALMASDDNMPRNWVSTYLNYNAKDTDSNPARPLNLNLDTVHNIFRDIEFSKSNNSCTSIDYKWANHLVKLYKNTLTYLTKDEYVKGIDNAVKEEFLKLYLTKQLGLDFWIYSDSPRQLIDDVTYSVTLSDGVHKDKTTVGLDYLRDLLYKKDYLPRDLLGETLLHKAVRADKKELVEKILSHSDNRLLNTENLTSLTALDIAIDTDNISLQDRLIEKNAVTSKYSAEYIANNNDIFNSILNKNKKIFNSLGDGNIFKAVIKYDKGEMCKILAQLDMPVDIKSFYYDLADLNDTEVIVLLWNKYRNDRYINEVASWSSPLANAVYKTNIELVKLFLSYPKIITTTKDIYGRTCLHYAVMAFIAATGETRTQAFEIIKLLIEANPALPDIKDYEKRGPGNPYYASDSEARSYIKSRKSTFFTKRKNTNAGKKTLTSKGGRSGFKRKTRSKRTTGQCQSSRYK